LLQQLRRRFRIAPTWQVLAPVLAELAGHIGQHGVFNMLLSDGHALYAHASTRMVWLQRQHPFTRASLLDRELEIDLASANGAADRMAVIATAPLTRDEPWQAFAPGETRVFADGQSVWHHRAPVHGVATSSADRHAKTFVRSRQTLAETASTRTDNPEGTRGHHHVP
jgi:glutamine amidotransferase